MYRIKYDGKYVKEMNGKYLVECSKEESLFSETIAKSIKDKLQDRIELEEKR